MCSNACRLAFILALLTVPLLAQETVEVVDLPAQTEPTPHIQIPPLEDFEVLQVERMNERDVDGSSFLCVPLLRMFSLKLVNTLLPGERVGLSGDHKLLGEWRVKDSIAMSPTDKVGLHWMHKISICNEDRIKYRYFIYIENEIGDKHIRRWEGQPYPRYLEPNQVYRETGIEQFGGRKVEGGWLTEMRSLELQFIWTRHVHFVPEFEYSDEQHFRIKLVLFTEQEGKLYPDKGNNMVEISRSVYNSNEKHIQPSNGVAYQPGEVLVFHVTMSQSTKYAMQLQFGTLNSKSVFGEVKLTSKHLKASSGVIDEPIKAPLILGVVGQLTLPYLLVEPLPYASLLNFASSFHRFWPSYWPTVHVGHRGAGKSYYDDESQHVENTLESMLYAYRLNADMVELDVQVTRDYVPVLWHDFGFHTAPSGLTVLSETQLSYVLIKDLTYKQLKSSRVFVKIKQHLAEYTFLNVPDIALQERIFPTLSEVYQSLPLALGIDVELKWPQPLQTGKWESLQTLDKNKFVDAVITATLEHGCGRALILSSFDADCCTMLRLKQNVFPVMFLSIGESKLWEQYKDLRTRSYADAVNFAQVQDLLGTAPHAEDFLTTLLDLGLELGQVVFVWGDNLNDRNTLEQFKRINVTGVIYDQLNLNKSQTRPLNFFGEKELSKLFQRQCVALKQVKTFLAGNATTAVKVKL